LLDSLQETSDVAPLAERLAEKLGSGNIAYDQIAELAALLEEAVPGLAASALHRYPALLAETELRKIFQTVKEDREAPLRVLPGSMVALIAKSAGNARSHQRAIGEGQQQ
jgi:hypothetical protein